MIEFFGNCLLRQFPDWGKRLTWFAGIMGALLWLDATSCFVCRGRDLVSVVEWLYLETRWYIWPALISLISFFLLMESPDWREPPAIWRNHSWDIWSCIDLGSDMHNSCTGSRLHDQRNHSHMVSGWEKRKSVWQK